MSANILIIEDDKNLREALCDNLELEGYAVKSCATINSAKDILSNHSIDLIILDIMLPDGEGFTLCQWVRERFDLFVLMLTARNLEKDIVHGFVSGTDDYLTKPYRTSELILRIKALLRRKFKADKKQSPTIQMNGFTINWETRQIKSDSHIIHLTKTAFDILSYLFEHINTPCSREDILNAVWGEEVYVDNRTVDNFISNLKKQLKLTENSSFQIKTIRGIGYQLSQIPTN